MVKQLERKIRKKKTSNKRKRKIIEPLKIYAEIYKNEDYTPNFFLNIVKRYKKNARKNLSEKCD